MKRVFLVVLLFAAVAFAQAPPSQFDPNPGSVLGVGFTFDQTVNPPVTGTAWAMVPASEKNFTIGIFDIQSQKTTPWTVAVSPSFGYARQVYETPKSRFYFMGAVGTTVAAGTAGTNVGWSYTGGGMAEYHIKGKFWGYGMCRIFKSSVMDGYRPEITGGVSFHP